MKTATVMETAKVTAGDIGGGGGDTAIAATATALKEKSLEIETYHRIES